MRLLMSVALVAVASAIHNSGGGLLRADVMLWRWGKWDAGIGAGLAVQRGPTRDPGWQRYFRAFAEPAIIRRVHDENFGPSGTFGGVQAGAAAGLARGRFRMDLEVGVLAVEREYPRMISLLFGVGR